MSRPNYRAVLSFDSERKVFVARVPELSHCTGEGATRAEALTRMEEELDALLANMAEKGSRPPQALDEAEFSGELQAKVSRLLHRDLTWQAQLEGVELGPLVAEILAAGLEHRRQQSRPRRPAASEGQGQGQGQGHSHGPSSDSQRPRNNFDDRRRGPNTAARFHDLLEDRASFVEYVRGLESDGRGPSHHNNRGDNRGRQSGPDNRGQGYNPGPGQGRRPNDGRPGPGRDPRGGGPQRSAEPRDRSREPHPQGAPRPSGGPGPDSSGNSGGNS